MTAAPAAPGTRASRKPDQPPGSAAPLCRCGNPSCPQPASGPCPSPVLALAAPFRTAHQAVEAKLRRHRQEPRDFAVEADGQWPTLYEAFETISHDGGDAAGHAVYFVPDGWTDRLDQIEAALHRLSREDLETFAIGDEVEARRIAARHADLPTAHALLDAFFEDWPDVMPSPGSLCPGPATGTCRGCGCHELNACIEPEGRPCAWAAPGLCTACVAIVRRVFTGPELTFLLHAAGGGDLNLTRPSATALTAEGVLSLRETLKLIAPQPNGDA